MELSNRRSMANTYFIQGDVKKALSTLISIKQSVIQSFNEDERKGLIKIEEKFNKLNAALSSSNIHSFNLKVRAAYTEAKNIASRIYSEYNDYLMDLLEKYGYLIGEQTDASKMNF